MSTDAGCLLAPGEAERRWIGTTFADFLATGELTGGSFALIDERAEQGEEVPLHTHPEDAESFYVPEGEITFFLGGQTVRTGAKSCVHITAGAVHGFRVESETARYLILTTPRHGEFYRAISDAEPGVEVDWERVGKACEDFAVAPVGDLPAGD